MAEKEQLGLHNLAAPRGAHKEPKRKGRGTGSGLGKTAGRGQKGQRSRAGGGTRLGFEGGQMPLIRRVPKRGFTNPFKVTTQAVNVRELVKVEGDTVTPAILADLGLVGSATRPVKILGVGEVTRAYVVQGCTISKTAREKIEQAGGRIEA